MRIGLDFDGVLAGCFLERLLGVVGIGEPEIGRLLVLMSAKRWFWKTIGIACFFIRPVDGAIYYVSRLIEEGHKVTIISSFGPFGCLVAKRCIRKMFGYDLEVIGVGWKNSKLEATRRFKLDVFVDDTLCKLVLLNGSVKHLFLFSQKCKCGQQEIDGIKTVFSWEDLYQKICVL